MTICIKILLFQIRWQLPWQVRYFRWWCSVRVEDARGSSDIYKVIFPYKFHNRNNMQCLWFSNYADRLPIEAKCQCTAKNRPLKHYLRLQVFHPYFLLSSILYPSAICTVLHPAWSKGDRIHYALASCKTFLPSIFPYKAKVPFFFVSWEGGLNSINAIHSL